MALLLSIHPCQPLLQIRVLGLRFSSIFVLFLSKVGEIMQMMRDGESWHGESVLHHPTPALFGLERAEYG